MPLITNYSPGPLLHTHLARLSSLNLPHTVLIVDDDAALRAGMKMLLGLSGHTAVTTAATLAEAREYFLAGVPSHLILDQNLPDGLGTDLLRELQSRNLPIRTALLTGSVDPDLASEAAQLGAETVLIKPPDWDRLVDWVATAPAA